MEVVPIVLLSAYIYESACLHSFANAVCYQFFHLFQPVGRKVVSDERLVHSSITYNNKHTCIHKKKKGRESQAPSRGHLPQRPPQRGPWEQRTRSFSQRPPRGVTEASEPRGPFPEQKRGCLGQSTKELTAMQTRVFLLFVFSGIHYMLWTGDCCVSVLSSFLGNVDPLILFFPYHCLLGELCNMFISL